MKDTTMTIQPPKQVHTWVVTCEVSDRYTIEVEATCEDTAEQKAISLLKTSPELFTKRKGERVYVELADIDPTAEE